MEKYVCGECKSAVSDSDVFCGFCGSLFDAQGIRFFLSSAKTAVRKATDLINKIKRRVDVSITQVKNGWWLGVDEKEVKLAIKEFKNLGFKSMPGRFGKIELVKQ